MLTIRPAVAADLPTVLELIHGAADWLHSRGYEQWPHSSPTLGPAAIGGQIERGETWLASDETGPVATIALSREGDPDFWTPAELAEPAVYVAKSAVARRQAGEGVGALVLRWAVDKAWADGCTWVRLDAWRSNLDLQAYYRRQGWEHVRTVDIPGRKSGALFRMPARPDRRVRSVVAEQDAPEGDDDPAVWRDALTLRTGAPVIAVRPGGPVAATITGVIGPDYGHQIVSGGWEHGAARPPVLYEITEASGRARVVPGGNVWLDPQRATSMGVAQ